MYSFLALFRPLDLLNAAESASLDPAVVSPEELLQSGSRSLVASKATFLALIHGRDES